MDRPTGSAHMLNGLPQPSPERLALARQLLWLLFLFGIIASISDFHVGNMAFSLLSMLICIAAALTLYLGRSENSARLPYYVCLLLIISMYLFGLFNELPQNQEKAAWISAFPFAFYYLGGMQTGSLLTILGCLLIPVAYWLFPLTHTSHPFNAYVLMQNMGAFVLCSILAFKYEQIRGRQEKMLRHTAECDPLTGLLNRRGFETVSARTVEFATRFQQPLSIVMIDLDDFKQVNDQHGHEAGDLLLKGVANLLQLQTRSADIAARWGGEEFVLLLPQSNLDGAIRVSEKIRAAIAGHHFPTGLCTASIGIALHDPTESLSDTVNRADQAMYRAKQSGKNRVEHLLLQPS